MSLGWADYVGEDIERDTWYECISLLPSLGDSNAIYRGHSSFDWKLETTLERALQAHAQQFDVRRYQSMLLAYVDRETEDWVNRVERELTRYFRSNATRFGVQDLPEAWDLLGWWELMQHHGAPTRLMDWSQSPFTALWFALEGHIDGSGDMALWIYDRRNGKINHSEAFNELRKNKDYETLDDRQRQNRLVQLILEGEDSNPALLSVTPRQFPRSVAQQSVFTVSPSIGVNRPAHWWIRKELATRVLLREEWKADMWAACRSMGLSRPSLFRDLDSLGRYVNESFLSGSDMPENL